MPLLNALHLSLGHLLDAHACTDADERLLTLLRGTTTCSSSSICRSAGCGGELEAPVVVGAITEEVHNETASWDDQGWHTTYSGKVLAGATAPPVVLLLSPALTQCFVLVELDVVAGTLRG